MLFIKVGGGLVLASGLSFFDPWIRTKTMILRPEDFQKS